jgi:hypothetical protein
VSGATWTILVPTIPERAHLLDRLLGILLPQVEPYLGDVTVLAWRNAGTPSLGDIRDALMRDAPGRHVSFIDDDDRVPEYYVEQVMLALAQDPDHVGFQLDYSTNGIGQEIVDHSLRHGRWHRTSEGQLVRDFTHIDPIRREIALRGTFVTGRPHRAEDRHWVKRVRPFLAGGSEVYIDKIMYYYEWREDTTAWQRPHLIASTCAPLPVVPSPYFKWHPESV